jgi:ribosomal protein S18 acetylase RimI-like enzyme
MDITYRLATPADAEAIVAVINPAFRNDNTDQVYLTDKHDDIDVINADGIVKQLTRPDCVSILAIINNEIAAHANVRKMDEKASWLAFIAVSVKQQTAGLGSKMLARAEEYVMQHYGSTRMEFDVVNTRKDLIAWYKKRGYKENGKTKPFPYEYHGNWQGILRDDLEFICFEKELVPQKSS